MSAYNVHLKRLALMLLPCAWRKPLIAAFAQSAVAGFFVTHREFMKWKEEQEYRLRHTGQVCRLRALLNDHFDPQQRRIIIEDAAPAEGYAARIYHRSHERGYRLPRAPQAPKIINRRGYGGANGYDFWIHLPLELQPNFNEPRLADLVNTYKLASKRWAIVFQ